MHILHVCSELYPLLKTGGLADVTGALPRELNQQGTVSRVLLPAFPAVRDQLAETGDVCWRETPFGRVRLAFAEWHGTGFYLIDAPWLYDRPGNPYEDGHKKPYDDNHRRFALLAWMAAELASGCDPYWRPDIVHGHDWHTGLMPAYLAARGYPARSVFTIHNLAYQGIFGPHVFGELALPSEFFDVNGVEYNGDISFMKAGIYYADHVTTVSPSYAREITTHEQGCGLEGLLAGRGVKLSGILNGVDETVWNPSHDPALETHFSADKLAGKARCKSALQQVFGLEDSKDRLLFAVVSRLTAQKGLHLVLEVLDSLIARGGQFVLLGSGDAALEQAFHAAALRHPGQVGVRIGYDEALSHQVMAGSDIIMVPSHFEPCGLTQLYGLKYGALPLVRRVGGLADTVHDCTLENLADGSATGFVFDAFNASGLDAAVRRAFVLWSRQREFKAVRTHAMQQDFSWPHAARHYLDLYQSLITH
ncbi:glycogen synthase GlgA [Chitinibacteraceae bacterium HSL-7]